MNNYNKSPYETYSFEKSIKKTKKFFSENNEVNRKEIDKKNIFLYIVGFAVCIILAAMYMPMEPDVANSPLVWQEFKTHGFSTFTDWKPTPDSWYFTIYPIHFLLFIFLDSSSTFALIISTAIFTFIISLFLSELLSNISKQHQMHLFFFLVFLSSFSQTYGYIAHPFSHNSTNAYGVVSLFFLYLLTKNAYILPSFFLCSIGLAAGISDPWFLAAYSLPILLSLIIISIFKDVKLAPSTIMFLVVFIVCKLNIIQLHFGWSIAEFRLLPFNLWPKNAIWIIKNIGSSLNITPINNTASQFTSSFLWIIIAVLGFYFSLKNKCIIIATCCLSIAAIFSSFIISYTPANSFSSRFIVNAIYLLPFIAFYVLSITNSKMIKIILLFSFCSSIISYAMHNKPNVDYSDDANEYIRFLKKNDLNFGYSEFWDMANIVTWKTSGNIMITPVYFSKSDGKMKITWQRGQTFNSHRTREFDESSPSKRFISIREGEQCPVKEVCIRGILEQFGQPDKILKFKDRDIFVYNRKIDIFK